MIPTAIIAGLLLGLWIRWWAVPVIGVAWAVVIVLVVEPSAAFGAGLLGAANALVGVLVAVGFRRVFAIAAQGSVRPRASDEPR